MKGARKPKTKPSLVRVMEFWFRNESFCPKPISFIQKSDVLTSVGVTLSSPCIELTRILFIIENWKLWHSKHFFRRFMSTHFRIGNNSNHLFSTDYNVLTATFKRNHCSFGENWLWLLCTLYIVHCTPITIWHKHNIFIYWKAK